VLGTRHESNARSVPVVRLGNLARRGPYHLDIRGTEIAGGAVRGPFDIKPIGAKTSVTYPALWAHAAEREHTMELTPDHYGVIRKGRSAAEDNIIRERAEAVWATASHAHINLDFRFNSQSLAAAYTAQCDDRRKSLAIGDFRRQESGDGHS
jgi:hypothetical protein